MCPTGPFFVVALNTPSIICCFFRFLSVECGLLYLQEIDFIETELDTWKKTENMEYVKELESQLDDTFSASAYENWQG